MKATRLFAVVLVLVHLPSLVTADERLGIPGLKADVEILTDHWGIDHIYAENEHDLFFAQGYAAARNRLFQFELWRRQATGTVAEILGRRELDRDIGTRLHMFRKDMTQELAHYHPRGALIINAYVDGINAYIEQTERHPDLLPIEFELLGIEPGKWTPAVVISRHQGLLSNVTTELRLGRAVAAIGAQRVKELDWFRPGDPVLELDSTIDGTLLTDDILHYYRAFRKALQFEPSDIVAAYRNDPTSHQRLAAATRQSISTGDGADGTGSNNWVVSGRFTQSGYPYIANDPHRDFKAPSLRYFVHLNAPGSPGSPGWPGWNVIGGGEPALPGISIGHNEYGGWGLTIFGQDNEDLYVYDTNPSNPNQYRYLDAWEDMRIIEETIAIRGESPETVELKYTRHGPVLYEDRTNHKAYALRAAWMEIGNAPYLASLRMNQATTWEEFAEACSYSRIPAENMIWGDVNKNIGYQAVGISPIRPNWSGLVPVPGDGRYEWDGYLPITALPSVKNPEKGYWATANNYMVPDDYPYKAALHYTWGDEMRGLRVDELLSSGRRFTIVDMMQFQHDELSIPARSIVPLLLLAPVELVSDRDRKAADALSDWDYVVDKSSIAAAIYVSFERRLLENMRNTVVPQEARALIPRVNKKRVIDWLVAPDGRFGEDPIAGRNEILRRSLTEGVADLVERLGPDMAHWQYGQQKFKHVLIRHALSPAVDDDTRAMLDVGPRPQGGYDSTLNNSRAGDNQTGGPSFRVILDAANWDNSIATNTPGQSGDPRSPHYRDLFDLWIDHQYFPLFYSRGKIESVTESRLVLVPAAAPDSLDTRYMPTPPVAKIVPHKLKAYGSVREDPYYWLNQREDPEVIAYLEAENEYTRSVMAHTDKLQETLFEEIKGRLDPDDSSVPYRKDDFYYYHRFEEGKEYAVYCRKQGSLDADEEILVDGNALSEGHEYFSLHVSGVSVDHNLLAYAIDTKGRRIYDVHFKNLATGELLDDVIENVTGSVAWANDNQTVFYAKQHPETLRSYQVYRHRLGTDTADDVLVFEETDETFQVDVFKTKSKRYIMISSEQTLTSEYRFLPADEPDGDFAVLQPRERKHEYTASHFEDHFFILTNDDAVNFRLMKTPVDKPGKDHWEEVIPHRADVLLETFAIFRDYLVLVERHQGLRRIRIRPWDGSDEHYLEFDEPAYFAYLTQNVEFDTTLLRLAYTSMTTPRSTYDYDMKTRERTLLKREKVLGDFDPSRYVSERLAATTEDGVSVPISLVYRKDTELEGRAPLVLYGYGSYGISMEATFSAARLSLLDRGFVYAIAHIRGGEDLGRPWYDHGKLLEKKNTFTDFIASAEHLLAHGYTDPNRLFAWGGSAGGLLMGAVMNLRPELFSGIVAEVPFVDVVTTMLDDTIPLTTGEYDEWGNPNDKKFYDYILSYSPYDNVEPKAYPNLLVTTGLHDSQVQYWEPAKWVAKLRAMKTDDNRLLMKTNMDAGHGGASGRFKRYHETALAYAFLLDLVK